MTQSSNRTIEKMKSALRQGVDEWLGHDIPAEGTEDHERWQSMLANIESIETLQDVLDHIESEGKDVTDFFMSGGYDLVDAGMPLDEIPVEIVAGDGDVIASHKDPHGATINIYLYYGKYFVVRGGETSIFDTELDALKAAGPTPGSCNQTDYPGDPEESSLVLHINPQPPAITFSQKRVRAVLVVVKEWPSGTMAFDFGSALKTALRAKKEDIKLIQLSPERIFRVLTKTTERQFRQALAKKDLSVGGRILFIELETK